MRLIRRVKGRRTGFQEKDVAQNLTGYPVQAHQCGGQPWLYHWTTRDCLDRILRKGLVCGSGAGLGQDLLGLSAHCAGRVFFSTDREKWQIPGGVLMRIPTSSIDCIYDGGLWDSPEGWYEERPADCYTQEGVPAALLEVWNGRAWGPLGDLHAGRRSLGV